MNKRKMMQKTKKKESKNRFHYYSNRSTIWEWILSQRKAERKKVKEMKSRKSLQIYAATKRLKRCNEIWAWIITNLFLIIFLNCIDLCKSKSCICHTHKIHLISSFRFRTSIENRNNNVSSLTGLLAQIHSFDAAQSRTHSIVCLSRCQRTILMFLFSTFSNNLRIEFEPLLKVALRPCGKEKLMNDFAFQRETTTIHTTAITSYHEIRGKSSNQNESRKQQKYLTMLHSKLFRLHMLNFWQTEK